MKGNRFARLGATDRQLDFPVVYASGLQGYAGLTEDVRGGDMTPLFEAIVKHVPAPPVDPDGPFQMRISSLDYNSYVGIIGVGSGPAASIAALRASGPAMCVATLGFIA